MRKLAQLATQLDSLGLQKEADVIDSLLKRFAVWQEGRKPWIVMKEAEHSLLGFDPEDFNSVRAESTLKEAQTLLADAKKQPEGFRPGDINGFEKSLASFESKMKVGKNLLRILAAVTGPMANQPKEKIEALMHTADDYRKKADQQFGEYFKKVTDKIGAGLVALERVVKEMPVKVS